MGRVLECNLFWRWFSILYLSDLEPDCPRDGQAHVGRSDGPGCPEGGLHPRALPPDHSPTHLPASLHPGSQAHQSQRVERRRVAFGNGGQSALLSQIPSLQSLASIPVPGEQAPFVLPSPTSHITPTQEAILDCCKTIVTVCFYCLTGDQTLFQECVNSSDALKTAIPDQIRLLLRFASFAIKPMNRLCPPGKKYVSRDRRRLIKWTSERLGSTVHHPVFGAVPSDGDRLLRLHRLAPRGRQVTSYGRCRKGQWLVSFSLKRSLVSGRSPLHPVPVYLFVYLEIGGRLSHDRAPGHHPSGQATRSVAPHPLHCRCFRRCLRQSVAGHLRHFREVPLFAQVSRPSPLFLCPFQYLPHPTGRRTKTGRALRVSGGGTGAERDPALLGLAAAGLGSTTDRVAQQRLHLPARPQRRLRYVASSLLPGVGVPSVGPLYACLWLILLMLFSFRLSHAEGRAGPSLFRRPSLDLQQRGGRHRTRGCDESPRALYSGGSFHGPLTVLL